MPSVKPYELLSLEDVRSLKYKNLKKYVKDMGLQIKFATRQGLLKAIRDNEKYLQEEEPEQTIYIHTEEEALAEAEHHTMKEDVVIHEAGRSVSFMVPSALESSKRTPSESKKAVARPVAGSRPTRSSSKRGSTRRKTCYTANDILASVSLFSGWSTEKIDQLLQKLEEVDFEPGEVLMEIGELGDEFFLVVDGTVEVIGKGGVWLADLGSGEYVGEQALIKRSKRNATVKAKTECCCLVCDLNTFAQIQKEGVTFDGKPRAGKRAAVMTKKIKLHEITAAAKTEDQINWLLGILSTQSVMADYCEHQLRAIIQTMKLDIISAESVIITQGEKVANKYYILEKGEVDVLVNGDKVARKGPQSCFGEAALMFDVIRSATCLAATDCEIWVLERDAFRCALSHVGAEKNTSELTFLKNVVLFENFTHHELVLLTEAFTEETYPADYAVLSEGDDPDKFYVIREGSVCWKKSTEEEGELPQGAYFGELALLNDDKRAASIVTLEETLLLELGKEDFHELLGSMEEIMAREAENAYRASTMPKAEKEEEEFPDKPDIEELTTVGVLGKGGFGYVTLVKDIGGDTYALKAIRKAKAVETGMEEYILGEKVIMTKLDNYFLVNLRGVYMDDYRVYFLLEVCLGGELFTLLRNKRNFEEPAARFFAGCVVEAFDHMHSKNIIYRDLKPENLVMDSKGYLKVTDFGFAKVVSGQTFTFCGTPDYLAPEIITNSGHGKGVDWWTLGILIYEMLSSMAPFSDDDPMVSAKKIIKSHVKFPKFFSSQSKTLILGLLRKKQTRRLGVLKGGADNIRNHPFFRHPDWSWSKLQAHELEPPFPVELEGNDDLSRFEDPYDSSDEESETESIDEEQEIFFEKFMQPSNVLELYF